MTIKLANSYIQDWIKYGDADAELELHELERATGLKGIIFPEKFTGSIYLSSLTPE